jgi:hypothetical protein
MVVILEFTLLLIPSHQGRGNYGRPLSSCGRGLGRGEKLKHLLKPPCINSIVQKLYHKKRPPEGGLLSERSTTKN